MCIRCRMRMHVYIHRGDARNVRVITGVRRTKRGIFGDFAWLAGPGARNYVIATNDYTSRACNKQREGEQRPVSGDEIRNGYRFMQFTNTRLSLPPGNRWSKVFTEVSDGPVKCTIISLLDSWYCEFGILLQGKYNFISNFFHFSCII